MTLYQAERHLLSAVLELGRQLLEVYFSAQVQAIKRICSKEGRRLHSYKHRVLKTVFGRLDLRLPYYYAAGEGGEQPLDEALALPEHRHSDLLCQMSEYLSTSLSYGKSLGFLERFFAVSFAPDTLSAMVRRDAELVDAFYEESSPELADDEAEIVVVQAEPDRGSVRKGVPLRRNEADELKKREAVVTGIYTISPRERTPEAVIAALFDEETDRACSSDQADREAVLSVPVRPMNKHLWASLDGKAAALDRLQQQAAHRDEDAVTKRALCDGAQALQEGIEERFGGYTLILDFVHVKDHLWNLGTAICHWTQRRAWVKARLLELLKEPPIAVIERIEADIETRRLSRAQQIAAQAEVGYLRRNQARMDYAAYLARGLPIATGVIEGACRHLVKARCEAGGMRWSVEGAGAVLRLRAVMINGHWDAYHSSGGPEIMRDASQNRCRRRSRWNGSR